MVRIKNLKKVFNNLNRLFEQRIISKTILDDIGEFSLDRIKAFTRSGKSIAGKQPTSLKKLAKSTVATREGKITFRKINGVTVPFPGRDERLDDVDRQFFKPRLSNLTFSGQLIESLKFKINSRTRSIEIFASGRRRKLAGEKKSLTNKAVASHAADAGRPFIGLDDNGIKRIKAMIIKETRKQIRKARLK